MKNTYYFELRNETGRVVVGERFECDFTSARRKGDETATKLDCPLYLYSYNDALHRWERLGVFRGNRKYTDAFGTDCEIKEDYTGLIHKKEDKQ